MAPSLDERIKALKARREAFRMEIEELRSVLNSPEAPSQGHELTIRLEELHTEYLWFTKNQSELDTYDDTGDLLRDRIALKSFYMQTKGRALEFTTPSINTQTTDSRDVLSPCSHSESVDAAVQLPKMNLPTFSGNYEDWPGFAHQFRSGVHDKPKLTDGKKLTYLRSCLTGEALRDIESLNSSPANYAIAWSILEKRYNQPKVIVANHLKALFEIQPLNRPAPRELRSFLGNAEAHYRALQPLQQPTADTMVIYLLMSKVDKDTSLKWREHTSNDNFPTLETLFEFLHERCRIIEPMSSTHHQATPSNPSQSHRNISHQRVNTRMNSRDHRSPHPHVLTMQVTTPCNFCRGHHYAQQCETFNRLSIPDRINLVNAKNLCTNCLGSSHNINACRSTTCKRCHQKHHTLLHVETKRASTSLTALSTYVDAPFVSETFLATAVVKLTDDAGQTHLYRVLLDSCSQAHLLTYRFFKKVQLTSEKIAVPLSGTNNMTSAINSQTRANIKSKFNDFSRSLTFLLVNKVSQNVPTTLIDRSVLNIPQNLPLADPQFHQSAEIDGLIGAQLFWDLLSVGCISLAGTDTKLHKTKLGWVIVGETISQPRHTTITCNVVTSSLEQQLSKFWEIEERSSKQHLSVEEKTCEAHYTKNISRDLVSGRYSVRLPFKENVTELGESYSLALKRFFSLERQLDRNPHIKLQYTAFLKEYLNLGHMSRTDSQSRDGYFLPHHAVSKEGSLTTKIRVVFDASARTTTGVSLNDTLMIGPTIQDDLFELVIRFRTHQYVLTADIAKMYRQIKLAAEHRQYHKILWREDHKQPIQTFILNTVTYGTASAPFLAIRTLQQLAEDEGADFPLASQALLNDFYVDDLLSGAQTFTQAEILRDQLIALTAKAGFQLRQWASNDARLIDPLRDPQNESMTLALTDNKKTLGLFWHPQRDSIGYTVKEHAPCSRITKRAILSRIAQLFDPLGLLGPTIVRAKLIMQELWKANIHWDEFVPADIHTVWNEFHAQLPALQSFSVPRKIVGSQTVTTELHGFCDASERAYGACLFLRSTNIQGTHTVRLICSKYRVAPVKVQSLPRLELCAAILLISLYRTVIEALKISIEKVNFWPDSMIALHWIRTPPHTLKQFVANRVSEIQQHSHANQWRHVPSSENPADILSRGSSPVELLNCKMWINGPHWLANEKQNWPITKLDPVTIPDQ